MKSIPSISTFRAFNNRNYALFFCGQTLSQIGTWMQRTAVVWVVYSVTHSAAMIGFSVFAQQFPSFLLSLFGGVVADRYPRNKILLITQAASMLQATLLAILVLTNHYEIWEILFLSAILGIINAFDVPARQPMVHDMVENKDDLANAISLNSAMVNMARLVGPAVSGMVLQYFGAGICFGINAVSFVAVIGSLLLMDFPSFTPPVKNKRVTAELKEGLEYLRKTNGISILLILLVVLSIFILPYDTLMPVFAKAVFKGDATTFGYVTGCIGLGALVGSFLLATVKTNVNLRKILLISILVLAAGLILFSQMPSFEFALPIAVILGLGSLTPMSTIITIIQVEAASNMRGRVMSYVAMAYFGMLPMGSLLIGSVSQHLGSRVTMLIQGALAIFVAGLFFRILIGKNSKTDIKVYHPE